MTISIRSIRADEVDRFREELLRTFGVDPIGDESAAERFSELLPPERTYAAFDGDTMVATGGSFPLELTVPGGTMPMAGLTVVTVRPTHRRRGILRALMDAHVADATARGEPISGLWASESAIYERFGYGVAVESEDLQLDASKISIAVPGEPDRIDLVDGAELLDELVAVHDRVCAARPGMFRRTPAWWSNRVLYDPPERRGGASSQRIAAARRDGAVTGWVAYRQRQKFDEGVADGSVDIAEMIAVDAVAEASLWHFVTHVDLFPKVHYWNAPTDSLLRWLTPQRRLLDSRRTDSLWLRPCDVPAALSGRAYAADGSLAIQLRDGGAFELTVDGGVGSCRPADGPGAVRMDRSALGSIFLGSVRPSLLARTGRIDGDAHALAEADRLFAWPVPAWCGEIF